jgi:hypothetical protein
MKPKEQDFSGEVQIREHKPTALDLCEAHFFAYTVFPDTR